MQEKWVVREKWAGAIDTALAHYIEDHRQKSNIVQDLDPEIVEALSTNRLPMSLEYAYSGGKTLVSRRSSSMIP